MRRIESQNTQGSQEVRATQGGAIRGLFTRRWRRQDPPDPEAAINAKLLGLGLTPDDLYDADDALDARIKQNHARGLRGWLDRRRVGAIISPGESIHKIPNPLTLDQEANFGDIALRALNRTDLDSPQGEK